MVNVYALLRQYLDIQNRPLPLLVFVRPRVPTQVQHFGRALGPNKLILYQPIAN